MPHQPGLIHRAATVFTGFVLFFDAPGGRTRTDNEIHNIDMVRGQPDDKHSEDGR